MLHGKPRLPCVFLYQNPQQNREKVGSIETLFFPQAQQTISPGIPQREIHL
jgi:hypothetical protein